MTSRGANNMAPGGYTCLVVIFGVMTVMSLGLLFTGIEASKASPKEDADDIFKWSLTVFGSSTLLLFIMTLAAIVMRFRQPDVYKDDGKRHIKQEMLDNAVKKYFDSMPVEEKYKILVNGRNS